MRTHDPEGNRLPQTGEGLHGETLGAQPTGDGDVPNTPEQNIPPLEYSGGPELPDRGPIAEGEARPATEYAESPLDRLPEKVSTAELVAECVSKYAQGGGF